MTNYHYISSPAQSLKTEIHVPGDKSISHRAVILGAMAKGRTTVSGFLDGEDCMATLKACKQMGVAIEGPYSQQLVIHGAGKYGLTKPSQIIDCGNSGTTMRLLAGLLAPQPFSSQLTGDSSLLKRPMERISMPLNKMGAEISTDQGKPPIVIDGGKTLKGIHYKLPIASAQIKSCLLLAGMYAKGETLITETGNSRDHTERMLAAFTYPVHTSENGISIHSENECLATDVIVPGDISSAAFFIVAATIIPDSELTIRNVGINPTRIGILHILSLMGADIRIVNKRLYAKEPVADLVINYAPALEGIDIPVSMVPLAIDEFPVIFIAAAIARGQTCLHGAKELRLKESDRIAVMADGLRTLGIDAQVFEDGLRIKGGQLQGGMVDSHDDHRIAMAFAIAGAIAKQPIIIKNCNNVMTSFPGFKATANQSGMNIQDFIDEK